MSGWGSEMASGGGSGTPSAGTQFQEDIFPFRADGTYQLSRAPAGAIARLETDGFGQPGNPQKPFSVAGSVLTVNNAQVGPHQVVSFFYSY